MIFRTVCQNDIMYVKFKQQITTVKGIKTPFEVHIIKKLVSDTAYILLNIFYTRHELL